MKEFVLERSIVVPGTLEEVFSFFSDPSNLEAITPPWLNFRIVECSTPQIEAGTTIDYALRLKGIPLRWRSLISTWDPPFTFVDEQVRGPYRRWHHTHTFEATEGGVRVGDVVRYAVLGGAIINRLIVAPDVQRIFDYRTERLQAIFAARSPTS